MVILERPSLLAALSAVQPFAAANASVSVICDDDGAVSVSTGTAECGARYQIMGRALLPGSVVLPLRPLLIALRCSAGSRVELAANGRAVAVSIDGEGVAPRNFRFAADNDTNEPTTTPVLDETAITAELTSSAFSHVVDRVLFASQRRTSTLGGWATDAVELSLEKGQLTLVATDTFRLAVARTSVEMPQRNQAARALIPTNALRDWMKVETETIKLSIGSERVTFEAGSLTAWSKTHSGQFPIWKASTLQPPYTLMVPVDPLRAAVETALALADKDEPQITLATKRGQLVVSAAVGQTRCESVIPVPGFVGPAVTIPLDGNRLLSTLRAFGHSSQLNFAFDAGTRPVVIRAGDGAECWQVPMMPRSNEARERQAVA